MNGFPGIERWRTVVAYHIYWMQPILAIFPLEKLGNLFPFLRSSLFALGLVLQSGLFEQPPRRDLARQYRPAQALIEHHSRQTTSRRHLVFRQAYQAPRGIHPRASLSLTHQHFEERKVHPMCRPTS